MNVGVYGGGQRVAHGDARQVLEGQQRRQHGVDPGGYLGVRRAHGQLVHLHTIQVEVKVRRGTGRNTGRKRYRWKIEPVKWGQGEDTGRCSQRSGCGISKWMP